MKRNATTSFARLDPTKNCTYSQFSLYAVAGTEMIVTALAALDSVNNRTIRLRVEQRIGRVDRIGQEHTVQVFNFWVKGTIEERVLNVLERRINIFEDTIARFTALAVLLPVVAGQSGNTGCQALAVTVRGITLGDVKPGGAKALVSKEAMLGFARTVFGIERPTVGLLNIGQEDVKGIEPVKRAAQILAGARRGRRGAGSVTRSGRRNGRRPSRLSGHNPAGAGSRRRSGGRRRGTRACLDRSPR